LYTNRKRKVYIGEKPTPLEIAPSLLLPTSMGLGPKQKPLKKTETSCWIKHVPTSTRSGSDTVIVSVFINSFDEIPV
jgi:hypothetical protein